MNKILQIENLHKTFKNKIKAVQGISLEIEKGDVFGFLGPNGAGKSTTIRMILGLIRPDQGKVIIDGNQLSSNRFKALRKVGALVEGPAFYDYLTAYENLRIFAAYSQGISKDRIYQVLKVVGLSQRSNDKVKNYSMGMKQRLGIAQALLNDPKVIILDEPTNGLDPYGVQEVRQLISRLSQEENITVFVSSHILTEIEQISNKVAIINKGKIITTGLVKELLNPDESVYEITGPDLSQLKQIIDTTQGISIIKAERLRFKIEQGKPEELLTSLVTKGAKISSFFPYKPSLEGFFFDMTRGEKDEVLENRAI